MITLDVTEFVTEPTECVSTLVTVKQSNNILRVCFSSKDLKSNQKTAFQSPHSRGFILEIERCQIFL